MNILKIRNLELGNGIPAICIPNTGKTTEEILSLTRKFTELPMDIMEWRVDWFDEVDDISKVKNTLAGIRNILGDTPLLCTFRTKKEGGVRELNTSEYVTLNKSIAETGLADLVDVEIFTGDETVSELIQSIHDYGCKVIASNHDFFKTPGREDIISRLCKMQEMKADVLKIAVMPQSKKDVLTLLSATEEMVSQHAKVPVVTMSMADLGCISRITGEFFGSCLTFGSGEAASAPGQIPASSLHNFLQAIHHSIP